MLQFSLLNKQDKMRWLPELFDLLYENMCDVAPSDLSRECEKALWLEQVSPALDKAPRQILLCFADRELAGYLQHYIRGDVLMVEELQLKRKFHSTFVFYRFVKHFLPMIPGEVAWVEAYADKRNRLSQKLMTRLGMQLIAQGDSPFVHF